MLIMHVHSIGCYVLSAALLLLLLAVVSVGPSRGDLVPWLPVFLVWTSMTTLAVDGVAAHYQTGLRPLAWMISSTHANTGATSSTRSLKTRPRSPLSESNRRDPLLFGYMDGPPSHYSGGTSSGGSPITLEHV